MARLEWNARAILKGEYMSTPNNGGPAFPVIKNDYDNTNQGMTLRDYFAGQVACGDASAEGGWVGNEELLPEYAAKRAKVYYAIADALLKEREKKA